ncbi:von Willebrand factor, type A [Plesiocystis pacifica SIR-1]|uniref:von Willebrand factor, type A n=2 Tax=Plesiocystis pacifica TaxID=191768 RepID=A6GHE4_9BACT|nr:von Willebrand factor, type A [Plesiocystis pacifica SIR-1]
MDAMVSPNPPQAPEPSADPTLEAEPAAQPSPEDGGEEAEADGDRGRRRGLIVAGVGLLTLGGLLNLDTLERSWAELQEPEPSAAFYDMDAVDEEEPPPAESVGGVGFASQRHEGEEGKMGKPTSKGKSGFYAMKGPNNAVPQMARNFDPDMAAKNAGILGVMSQQQGHFLTSPYGGSFAVGNDDEDVWGGLTGAEVGEAYGVGGLGLVGTGRGGGGIGEGTIGGVGNTGLIGSADMRGYVHERSVVEARQVAASFVATGEDRKSTFSIDVDTASYASVRQSLRNGWMPDPGSVRTEEMINYFDYGYVAPSGGAGAPFAVHTEVGPCPWAPDHRLVQIGVQATRELPAQAQELRTRNLVFLLDVSGSMSSRGKLPLIKHGFTQLVEQLGAEDHVSIVVYAGAAGVVLPPTSGDQKETILGALDRLEAGGGTNGSAGIVEAYELAQANFVDGGVNRVILGTDGDFNVGLSDHDALVELIEQKRESGVFLSVLGVGGHYDDELMEQLADHGNGNYAFLDGKREAEKVLVEEIGGTLTTIAKDVKVQVAFNPEQVTKHRLIAYQNRRLAHRDFNDDTKDAGEIGVGHNVTALYEIIPADEAEASEALMSLELRYKKPDGHRSTKVTTSVRDAGRSLDQNSDDFRFAAAVAGFGESLAGRRPDASWNYADTLELAQGALGEDARCLRHEFLELAWRAGMAEGEELSEPELACVPKPKRVPPTAKPASEPGAEPGASSLDVHVDVLLGDRARAQARAELWAFTLEVLRLLPPLLALPLFVMAWRPRRRRRR